MDWNADYISWKPVPASTTTTASSLSRPTSSTAPSSPADDAEEASDRRRRLWRSSRYEVEDYDIDGTSFLSACMSPRPTAWISVHPPPPRPPTPSSIPPSSDDDDDDDHDHHRRRRPPLVALVEGYCGASDRPPTLMLGSDSIPPEILEGLRTNGTCVMSVATGGEIMAAMRMSMPSSSSSSCRSPTRGGGTGGVGGGVGATTGPAMTFEEAGLRPTRSTPSVLSDLPAPPARRSDDDDDDWSNTGYPRPPAVDDSPVHMHCRLVMDVPLLLPPPPTTDDSDDDTPLSTSSSSSMLLLQIDAYVIRGDVIRKQSRLLLSPPEERTTVHGNPDVRGIVGKIDCLLLRPLASLGRGRFGKVESIYHMERPRPQLSKKKTGGDDVTRSPSSKGRDRDARGGDDVPTYDCFDLNGDTCNNVGWESNSMWEIDHLLPFESIRDDAGYDENRGDGETITYAYRLDSRCSLGYNPMKQVVCPRFVGWISSYEPDSSSSSSRAEDDDDDDVNDGGGGRGRRSRRTSARPIPHISPYSFCVDVARGSRPMIAFAACPRSDEFDDSDEEDADAAADDENDRRDRSRWKDAQRDAERTGYFCVNVVSQELAWAMNASAAPLGKGLSEFRLMEGGPSCTDDGVYNFKQTIPSPMHAPTVNAPFVPQSPSFIECRYVKTVKIPAIFENDSMYSLIIGEVVNIHIRRDCLKPKTGTSKGGDDGGSDGKECFDLAIDLKKVRPVSRLGYSQEYTVISDDFPQGGDEQPLFGA